MMGKRLALALFCAGLAACQSSAVSGETVVQAPVATTQAKESGQRQAVFAGGCFWGVEAVFSHVKGVSSAVSGYHGGPLSTANYDAVSSGSTGHAEALRVTYDPAQVRYDELLRILFSVVIDPTQRDGQGPDHGDQYRSALVPLDAEQRRVGSAYLAQIGSSGLWRGKIATRIEPYRAFYPAESYHQDFIQKNPSHPYITYWDAPKVAALKKLFPAAYKADFTPR
jgi:peptide-methionine (S)-S-oxide reductase